MAKAHKIGNVYSINLGNGKYIFAKIVRMADFKCFNTYRNKPLIYVYQTESESPKIIPSLRKEKLLGHPMIFSINLYEEIFIFQKNIPVSDEEIFEKHFFWHGWDFHEILNYDSGQYWDEDDVEHKTKPFPLISRSVVGYALIMPMIEMLKGVKLPIPSPEYVPPKGPAKREPELSIRIKNKEFPKKLDISMVDDALSEAFEKKGYGGISGSGSGQGEVDLSLQFANLGEVKKGIKVVRNVLWKLGFPETVQLVPYGLEKYAEQLGALPKK